MKYQEAAAYINNIPKFTKEKSAPNLGRLLELFGHPEQSFRYIHVAGTNGKGSVCAYIDSILRCGGLKTGMFTSPHLVEMTERIRVDGRQISREDFAALFEEVKAAVDEGMAQGYPHPTFFEWLYLMAMIWFSRQGVAYGVIETGLGGRLDATNIITHPAASVITSISLDHTAILGDTIEQIAAEKAGIIKEGTPLICDGTDAVALQVIKKKAKERGVVPEVFDFSMVSNLMIAGNQIDFKLDTGSGDGLRAIHLNTRGVYQIANSSLAFMTVKKLAESDAAVAGISEDEISQGLALMHWPGRLEEVLPQVYVDGAHNVGGAQMLAESVMTSFSSRPVWIVFAVANDKDYAEMAHVLGQLPNLQGVFVTMIDGERSLSPLRVAGAFHKYFDGSVRVAADVPSAIRTCREKMDDRGVMICTGSLYLVGMIKESLGGNRDAQL